MASPTSGSLPTPLAAILSIGPAYYWDGITAPVAAPGAIADASSDGVHPLPSRTPGLSAFVTVPELGNNAKAAIVVFDQLDAEGIGCGHFLSSARRRETGQVMGPPIGFQLTR